MCMKLKNKILVLAIAVCALTGCNPAADFAVTEAGMPTLNGLSSLHGSATVENDGRSTLTIENATFTVRYRDRELCKARLLLPVEVPPGGARVRYDLALEGLTLASIQTLQSRILSNPDAITVDLDGWIRWGRWRKKIELRGVEATRIMGIIF